MNLFNTIPSNFFSVLASRNKEIYVDALMLLHQLFRYELNIEVSDYLSSLIALIEDRSFVLEEDDEVVEGGLTANAKARLILNRFIKTGWVDKEFMDGSFTEIITPRNYAIQVMKLLSELGDNRVQEYNSLVFSTYSSLKQAKSEHRGQMYEAVLTAKANTEQLIFELKSLYHGIRGHLRRIQEQSDVNLLLQNHFEEYKQMADRIYHPIKTMDSIHRYMAPIQEILSDILGDEELMSGMRKRAVSVRKYEHEEDADREIISAIDYILDIYQSIGGIVNEIDKKHSTYTKSSIEKIQYLMTADQSIKGKLVELLKAYTTSATVIKKERVGRLLEEKIRVNRQEFIDGKSLYHKNVRSRRVTSTPLEVSNEDGFSDGAMAKMLDQISNGYSLSRIRSYVLNLFKDMDIIHSEDITIGNDSDFILLMLAVIRASERGMNYRVQTDEGTQITNGYKIPNMEFTHKKGGMHHVE